MTKCLIAAHSLSISGVCCHRMLTMSIRSLIAAFINANNNDDGNNDNNDDDDDDNDI